LESVASQEDDPTVVAMLGYLLALDELCDLQHDQVRRMTARAEAIKSRWHKARVELAKTEAHTSHTENCVIAFEEELLEQADHHNKLLRNMYLVERAGRGVIPRVPTCPSWMESRCFSQPALIKGCASSCHPPRQHLLMTWGPMERKFWVIVPSPKRKTPRCCCISFCLGSSSAEYCILLHVRPRLLE
jgi:hypothetical protein